MHIVSKAVTDAGWSSLVARRAHNPKVVGSNPAPATNFDKNILHNKYPRSKLRGIKVTSLASHCSAMILLQAAGY